MQFDLSILWLQPTLQPGVSMNYLPLLSTLAYEWECCRASALSFSISCTWLLLTSLYSGVFGVLHSMDTAREEEVAKPLAPIACSWHICTHNTGILAPGLKPAIIVNLWELFANVWPCCICPLSTPYTSAFEPMTMEFTINSSFLDVTTSLIKEGHCYLSVTEKSIQADLGAARYTLSALYA